MIRGLTARLLLVGGLAFLLCAGTFAVVLSARARGAGRVREPAGLQRARRGRQPRPRARGGHGDEPARLRRHAATRRSFSRTSTARTRLRGRERSTCCAATGENADRWRDVRRRRAIATASGRRSSSLARGVTRTPRSRRDRRRRGQAPGRSRCGASSQTIVRIEQRSARAEREHLDGVTSRAITLASIALLAIPLLLAVLVVASARRVSRPLQRLARAAHRVQEGDLEARVEEDGNNEVADLARSFNAMAQSLAEARVELEQHNAELEAQGAAARGHGRRARAREGPDRDVPRRRLRLRRRGRARPARPAAAVQAARGGRRPWRCALRRRPDPDRARARAVRDGGHRPGDAACRASRPTPSSASSSATCCSRWPAPAGRSAS